MTFVEKHFGRQILGRSAQCVCARLAVLGETEISQAQIALLVDQNILGLQIAIDDIKRVKVLKHQRDLCGIKPKGKIKNG